MESSMAIVGQENIRPLFFFSVIWFRVSVTKRREGTGHSNVQTAVRGVGKTQVRPFFVNVLQGNDSLHKIVSVRKLGSYKMDYLWTSIR